jgi:Methyltransferase FkbM domain
VKIDVEGAEYAVLSGMKSFLKKNNLKTVIVEITPKFLKRFNHNKDGIYALMEECGFQATVHSSDWQYDEVFIR